MEMKIEYAVNIIVIVKFESIWQWYVSNRDYWILDYIKWQNAFSAAGYKVPTLPLLRLDIPIVNNITAHTFLDDISSLRVGTASLSGIFLDKVKQYSSWEDILDIFPVIFVDFDGKRLLSIFPEPISFEDYVPEGWSGEFKDFYGEIPEEQRYWIVNGRDYLEELSKL